MANQPLQLSPKLQIRLGILQDIIPQSTIDRNTLASHLQPQNGTQFAVVPVSADSATPALNPALLKRVEFTNTLSATFDDYEPLVKSLATSTANFQSLRDVAINIGVKDMIDKIDAATVPASISDLATSRAPTANAADLVALKKQLYANSMRRTLFQSEPTAVVAKMLSSNEMNLGQQGTTERIRDVLTINADWNIRTTSVHSLLNNPTVLAGIAENEHANIVTGLKLLSRIQAVSPSPEVMPALLKNNIVSAFQITNIPRSTFTTNFKDSLGDLATAEGVFDQATTIKVRSEMMLLSGVQSIRGTGLVALDGSGSPASRLKDILAGLTAGSGPVNMETLFGDITSYCDCDECLSVHSPAAYYVELLQFLRNNNLDPSNPHTNQKNLSGTLLEQLLQRRPDLTYIKLTCKNTNTSMPYLDLALEVMESYVAHAPSVDPFNIEEDATSAELLAEPKHVNLTAYKALGQAIFPPAKLPFSMPETNAREFLKAIGTTKLELLQKCWPQAPDDPSLHLTPAQSQELRQISSGDVRNRFTDAESIEMSQEEYVLVTQQSFYPKRWFELTKPGFDGSDLSYRKAIGFDENVSKRFGYATINEMFSTDSTSKLGVSFVKKQLLPRLNISYVDLLAICQTWILNPQRPPPGSNDEQVIFGIKYSYRFLQNLVDQTETVDMKKRYKKLVDFLAPSPSRSVSLPAIEGIKKLRLDGLLSTDDNASQDIWDTWTRNDWERWVLTWFVAVGKTLIMQSGEGPKLPFSGELILATTIVPPTTTPIFVPGKILTGTLLPPPVHILPPLHIATPVNVIPGNPPLITEVFQPRGLGQKTTPVFTPPTIPPPVLNPILNNPINSGWWKNVIGNTLPPAPTPTSPITTLTVIATINNDGDIMTSDGNIIGYVSFDGRLVSLDGKLFTELYSPPKNGLAVRQLNGDFVGILDDKGYLRMFTPGNPVVAWSNVKDSCSIEDTILQHLDSSPVTTSEYEKLLAFLRLWKTLGWTVDETDTAIKCISPDGTISVDLIHGLAKMKKLMDVASLSLTSILPFWTRLDSQGATSGIYAQLFLGYNTRSMDNVFVMNSYGSALYQNPPEKITAHAPILQATLKLSLSDITAIMAFRSLADALTIDSISVLYRHSTLAKALGVPASRTPDIITLLGDPFISPEKACNFWDLWNAVESASFTIEQLQYLCAGKDDLSHPIAIREKSVLTSVKALRDAVLAIELQHQPVALIDDNSTPGVDTANLIRSELGLAFDDSVVDFIDQLLSGRGVYTTNAPKNLTLVVPPDLERNFKYFTIKGVVQMVGILSSQDMTRVKALAGGATPNTGWAAALSRLQVQTKKHFDKVLDNFGGFPSRNDALSVLYSPDDLIPAVTQTTTPQTSAPTTAIHKRRYFLHYFIDYLRNHLISSSIMTFFSALVGLQNEVCQFLLSEVLTDGNPQRPALEAIRAIANQNSVVVGNNLWSGYFSVPINGFYTFYIESDTAPAKIVLDREQIIFKQQGDPTNLWISSPISLTADVLYALSTTGSPTSRMDWSFGTTSRTAVPDTAFLVVDDSQKEISSFVMKLQKFQILINGFGLVMEEIRYFQTSQPIDFSNFTISYWKRMNDYKSFINKIDSRDISVVELFKWARGNDNSVTLPRMIANVTGWLDIKVQKLLSNTSFTKADFITEGKLIEVEKTLSVATRTGVDIDMLFSWSKPFPPQSFDALNVISDQIQAAFRRKYVSSEWNLAVKSINDRLRQMRKDALIAYLLVQDSLKGKITDADGLFEYFLIDCQMSSCIETSRIKQAISTVQLFVQRCLFGLEGPLLSDQTIDRQRWDALQTYRPWEASVKIRLWPENWAEASIRDDKSQFFKEFESDLLQRDLSNNAILIAFKSYLMKMSTVSKLIACGIYVEQFPRVSSQFQSNKKIHLFARTLSIPASFFYRNYSIPDRTWSAWEDIKLDVPIYEDSAAVSTVEIGTFLTPTVYMGRLLVFFPHFCKKTTVTPEATQRIPGGNNTALVQLKPAEQWEIKLAWSEYIVGESGAGKWSPKQSSERAVYTPPRPVNGLEGRDDFRFIPNIFGSALTIDIVHGGINTFLGRFIFTNNSFDTSPHPNPAVTGSSGRTWHFMALYDHPDQNNPGQTIFRGLQMHSLQAVKEDQSFISTEPYVFFPRDPTLQSPTPFQGPHAQIHYEGLNHIFDMTQVSTMAGKINTDSADPLADMVGLVQDFVDNDTKEAYGGDELHELRYPNSIYFWEVRFHAIFLVADQLLQSQQFEAALKMWNYIFDPLSPSSGVWKFPPFRKLAESQQSSSFQASFLNLAPGEPDSRAIEWRNHPFQPHVVARGTPVTYMKMVVMKYIETLIAWGDDYFRMNTLETIPSAIQCYIFASHIYGPRGEKIPKRGTKAAQTYMSLLNNWDALDNAMVELELVMPSGVGSAALGGTSDNSPPMAPSGASNLFGFATTLYFYIPNNPQFNALRNTIDDRLFKIRNCQDINGITRRLPLFEPPIDPALLVQAAASGVSISSALNDLNTPMPQFRFRGVLQKALELCQELISFSSQLLTMKERSDAESLALLQSRQEQKMRSLIMDLRTKQQDEANQVLESVIQSRAAPVYRMKYYFKLLGLDVTGVPDETTDFIDIAEGIDGPVKGAAYNMITEEKQQQDELVVSTARAFDIGSTEALVAQMHAIPSISVSMEPWGIGASISAGAEQLASRFAATARYAQIYQTVSDINTKGLNMTATAKRAAWERIHQANVAGYEIKNIDKQLLAQRIRIDVAVQEIKNQQQLIDNQTELNDFLHSKFTNQQLYSWMDGSLRTLQYQAYTLAYDMALKAQKTFKFERPYDTRNFITFGYWGSGQQGLLAGQSLLNDLQKLQTASQEKRGYDFEAVKHVSLRQWCPLALFTLRETGLCEFEFPEILFDMDFPGQYLRRISSIAVTIPCVVGPYMSVNCTVRLLSHKYRTSPQAADGTDYIEKVQEDGDPRFSTTFLPGYALALSSGVNDSGRIDLKAATDMYNPIEGAGTISRWRLELPDGFRQFDYNSISDVIFHINYTALDGGDRLKTVAATSVKDYVKSVVDLSREQGLFAVVDLRSDYAQEWYQTFSAVSNLSTTPTATTVPKTNTSLTLSTLSRYLPMFAHRATNVMATDVYILSPAVFTASIVAGNTTAALTSGSPINNLNLLVASGVQLPVGEWKLNLTGAPANLDSCWLLLRYTLL